MWRWRDQMDQSEAATSLSPLNLARVSRCQRVARLSPRSTLQRGRERGGGGRVARWLASLPDRSDPRSLPVARTKGCTGTSLTTNMINYKWSDGMLCIGK